MGQLLSFLSKFPIQLFGYHFNFSSSKHWAEQCPHFFPSFALQIPQRTIQIFIGTEKWISIKVLEIFNQNFSQELWIADNNLRLASPEDSVNFSVLFATIHLHKVDLL